MTDAMFRQVLASVTAELRENREYMQSLAHDISVVCGTCMRIEAQVSSLAERLDDLREDHDRVCIEIAQTDRAIAKRITQIEKQAAWVRAWAAGAAAAVTGMLCVLGWVASRLPQVVDVVGGK